MSDVENDDDNHEEEDKDPRIKELSDEAARYRVRAKEAESKTEEVSDELQAARVELAVRREAATRSKPFADLDVVLSLVRDAIAVDDDGQPVEVAAALDHLADRHPYLLEEHQAGAPERTDPALHVPSGTSMNKRRGGGGIDRKKLARKYPALRR